MAKKHKRSGRGTSPVLPPKQVGKARVAKAPEIVTSVDFGRNQEPSASNSRNSALPISDGSSDDTQESFIETLRRNDQELAYRLTRLNELFVLVAECLAIQTRVRKWSSEFKRLSSERWRSNFKRQCKRKHRDYEVSLVIRLHEHEVRRKQLMALWWKVKKEYDRKFRAYRRLSGKPLYWLKAVE